MSEHTPAPTPDRAVYGFVLYLLFNTLFIIYIIWAFVPTNILEDTFGLYYLPDKYFALYLPHLILCGITLFAFFIYPSLSLLMTPDIDDPVTIRDRYTIYKCRFSNSDNEKCDNNIEIDFSKTWTNEKYCNLHKIIGNPTINNNISNDDEICDCPDGNFCLIRENPEHLKQMKARTKIPTVCDLDLADVCKEMFGNHS